jgi:hypothetical protein
LASVKNRGTEIAPTSIPLVSASAVTPGVGIARYGGRVTAAVCFSCAREVARRVFPVVAFAATLAVIAGIVADRTHRAIRP